MQRTLINDGWSVRSWRSVFQEGLGGDEWEAVTLPHDALLSVERTPAATPAAAYFPSGAWQYTRSLQVPAEAEGRTMLLEFEGVQRDAVVIVNGSPAAHQPYGYTGFTVQIDHLLRLGEENELRVDARVGDDSRWYPGGGIYRNAWLLEAGPVHLVADSLDVRTPEIDDDGAVVAVGAVVRNRATTTLVGTVRVELLDPTGEVVVATEAPATVFPGDELVVRQRLFVDAPRRWGPDHPVLYSCRVTLMHGEEVLDQEATAFGIRTLSLDPRRGLRINGEAVLLRGACVHHDNGPIGAATIDRAEERRVELLKAAGFNALRSAHNPMSRAMLNACDRLGVLVMDEVYDSWLATKTSSDHALRVVDRWQQDVEAMVRKDRNHPAVVFYSIGNEVPDGSTPVGLHHARQIAELVRALDNTRFVTQAVTGMLIAGPELFEDLAASAAEPPAGLNSAAVELADIMAKLVASPRVGDLTVEAFSLLDAAGYNYMESRFRIDGEDHPQRVIMSTESHPRTVDAAWASITELPHVIGEFTWTGWDYLGEAGIGRIAYGDQPAGMAGFHAPYPGLAAWCGDIDITGYRRPQSYFRELVFGLRSDPYLTVWRPEHHGQTVAHKSPWGFDDVVATWSWPGFEGKPVTVVVYADADEVEVLLDGTPLGRAKVERFRAELETTYAPGQLEAVAWRDGAVVGRTALRSSSGPVLLDARVDRAEIAASHVDAAFVELAFVDASGTLCPTADRMVTVEVEGPAVLQGLASANPVTDEPFTGPSCTTFDGRALAVVRPAAAGTITVTATAQGCEPAVVRIEAR